MNGLRIKSRVARVRAYAVRLAKTEQNSATPSRLALALVKAEYENVREDLLINEARNILRVARLAGFAVNTKADAVAVIRGIGVKL